MNREVDDLMIVDVGWNVIIVLEADDADDDNDDGVKDSTNLQHDGDRYVQIIAITMIRGV
jgi:hypothetical protein